VLEHDRLVDVSLQGFSGRAPADEGLDVNASASSPLVADATAHQRVIEDFILAIESGKPCACDGREGLKSLALVEAIYASARERRPVALYPYT
jgi:UDP-N-acetyl-2-amino-2-deoxyglucuronate dehydrogenase